MLDFYLRRLCCYEVYPDATLHRVSGSVATELQFALCYTSRRRLLDPGATPRSKKSPVGQRVGYMRVSTLDQNEQRQLVGVDLDRTFLDKASSKDTKRPQLEAMLASVREGDTVICHSMDRLARNLDDLRKIVLGLTGRGIQVQFVKESLTFTGADSPMANLLLSVMGAFSELSGH